MGIRVELSGEAAPSLPASSVLVRRQLKTGTCDITAQPGLAGDPAPFWLEGRMAGRDVPSSTSPSTFRRVICWIFYDTARWMHGPEFPGAAHPLKSEFDIWTQSRAC